VKASIRLSLIGTLCATLTGCAFGTGILIGVNVSLSKVWEKFCLDLARMDIVVSEVDDLRIPGDESQGSTFEPVKWQVERQLLDTAEGDMLAELAAEKLAASYAGTLVITERAVLFIPSQGTKGVRIPFASIVNTVVRYNLMGEPRAVVIKTCGRRLDVFTFWQKDGSQRQDPRANAQAVEQIDARWSADTFRTELWMKSHHEVFH
jgi:hypothetical protein